MLALTPVWRNAFHLRLLLIRENEVGLRSLFTRKYEFLMCYLFVRVNELGVRSLLSRKN